MSETNCEVHVEPGVFSDLSEIDRLSAEVELLRAQVEFLRRATALPSGTLAESLVAEWLGGKPIGGSSKFDVIGPDGNLTIEVKFARLSCPKGRDAGTRRWVWSKPFGEFGNKVYDRLILIGERDARYSEVSEADDVRYSVFDLPYSEVTQFSTRSDAGRRKSIQLTTNPDAFQSEAAKRLFRTYKVTPAVLRNRYRMKSNDCNA